MKIKDGIKPFLVTTGGIIISGLLSFSLFYLAAFKFELLTIIFGVLGAYLGGYAIFLLFNFDLSTGTWVGLLIWNLILTGLGLPLLIIFRTEIGIFFPRVDRILIRGFPLIFLFGTIPYFLGTSSGNSMRLRMNKMDEKKRRKVSIIISCLIVFGICAMYLTAILMP